MAKKKGGVLEQEASSVLGSQRKVRVKIRGRAPGLLMSSKGGMEEGSGKAGKLDPPEIQAEKSAYWTEVDGNRELALPWICLYKCIVEGAKRYKFKGRETMNKIVAATISCEHDMIPLGTDKYKHDARWGRIPPKTGGVVMLNRAHLPEWECTFIMVVDDEFYPADKLKEVVATAGKLVGVCANRPQLQGPYGRFDVVDWEIIE